MPWLIRENGMAAEDNGAAGLSRVQLYREASITSASSPGTSQAAEEEELGGAEEHPGQHGQRHVPHHLVRGAAVPAGQPHLR